MILIKKAKGKGYFVSVTGNNGEKLNTSEVLETKQSCIKNIVAAAAQYDNAGGVLVKDETNQKMFLVNKAGKKIKF